MKKKISLLLIVLVAAISVCALSAIAFADGGSDELQTHSVTYNLSPYQDQVKTVNNGETAPKLALSDFHFAMQDGEFTDELYKITWYTSADMTNEYDFGAVNGDITLYGKLETAGDFDSCVENNAYGWNVSSGELYYGDPAFNKTLTGQELTYPFEMEEDGTADFMFNKREYCTYVNGLDVTKTFTVTVDVGDIYDYFADTQVTLGLYDKLSVAYATGVYRYENMGSMAMIHYWVNGESGGANKAGQIHNHGNFGTYAAEGKLTTKWSDVAAAGVQTSAKMKELLESGEGKLTFTFHIGEESSYAEVNGEHLIDMSCKQSDFIGGKAYVFIGSETGANVKIKVEQEMGKATAKASNGVTVKSVEAKNGFVIADLTVSGDLKAEIGGKEVVTEKLEDGKYAVALPREWLTEDFEISFSVKGGSSDNKTDKGGCGSAVAATASVAAAVCLLGAAVVLFARKKKGVN